MACVCGSSSARLCFFIAVTGRHCRIPRSPQMAPTGHPESDESSWCSTDRESGRNLVNTHRTPKWNHTRITIFARPHLLQPNLQTGHRNQRPQITIHLGSRSFSTLSLEEYLARCIIQRDIPQRDRGSGLGICTGSFRRSKDSRSGMHQLPWR